MTRAALLAKLKDGHFVEMILVVVANYIVLIGACGLLVNISYGLFGTAALSFLTAINSTNAIIKYRFDERLRQLERDVRDGK